MHHSIDGIAAYSLRHGCQRVIRCRLRHQPVEHEKAITVTLPTNKGIIASHLNLTQATFSRILQKLARQGLISVECRRINIPDVDRLQTAIAVV
ncbi:helix-turn-helix domain-containing protein [Candidatus Accumulibacter necessarius]|uniref:helix-turn-helix domain-containing protein n=1 Tax=Candidatus Accumulibacter necessarius TaxID=2954386 RepID=UPI003DA7B5CB